MYQATFISNTLKVRPLTEDEEVLAPTLKDSVYDFCADGACGYYAIRETKEKAIQALLDYFSLRIVVATSELSELKASRNIIKASLHTPKCWNCKHWGSTTMYGVSHQEGHVIAVSNLQNAHCPFQLKKNELPRCMSRYHEVCEHFEECVNNE